MSALKMPDLSRLPDFVRHPFRSRYLVVMGLMLAAAMLGVITPLYVLVMGEKLSKVMALPAAMLFGLLLIYDRKLTLMVIILLRAGAEKALMLTSLTMGGIPLGVGGLLNGCVIMIAAMLVFERRDVVPRIALLMWVPFLLILTVQIIPSPSPGEAVRQTLALVSYYAIFIAGFFCGGSREQFRNAIKLVVASSLIPVMYGLVELAMNFSSEFRMYSTFSHPNVLAFYLTVVISLTFYLIQSMPKEAPGWQRLAMAAYLFLLIGTLLMTKTRSAWGATAICFALYGVLFDRRYLVYMALGGVVALLLPGVGDRLLDLTQGNEVVTYANLNSFAWRVFLWQTALDWMSPLSYFLGNGLQSFKFNSINFFPFAAGVNWQAHSVYVQLLFEMGAVGLATYLWLSWRALKGLWPLIRIDRLAAFSLIMLVFNFLVCAVSDNMFDYLVYNWYWWFAVGAGSAWALHVPRELKTYKTSQHAATPR